MRTVRTALAGLTGQVALLALLAATVGVGTRGWTVGLAIGVAVDGALAYALLRAGAETTGPANVVTLIRATFVVAVAALVADGTTNSLHLKTTLMLAAIALTLDAVDGQVARRTRSVSTVGARFDAEVDALLILVLSVAVAPAIGWWVLAIGLWRYAFAVAGWILPWLRAPLPSTMWGKTVAVVQGVALTLALSGLLPHVVMVSMLAAALTLLTESFCHAVWWLWTRRPHAPKRTTRLRRIGGGAVTALALIVTWAAFVAPDRPDDLTLTSFLRIPIDGLALVAVALLLPGRARRFLVFLAGVALAGLTLARTLDIGFFSVLDRPFSPVTDWGTLQPGMKVLIDSIGRNRAILATGLALAIAGLTVAAIMLGIARVTHVAVRHRKVAARVVVPLGVVSAVCAALGVATTNGMPVASRSAAQAFSDEIRLVRADLRDEHRFTAQLAAADEVGLTPPGALLNGLRGKDVLLVFIESYGRVAVDGSSFAPQVDALLKAGTTSLTAAGFLTRSAFLTSPTFGSRSWFAHSTLQSGLWIDNAARYARLMQSKRFTLSAAFKRAGWRTVFDLPATRGSWPQGQRFYQFDTMYGATDVGYHGPAFSFAQIPDQYTLQALNQRELDSPSRPPLFAEVVLDSSHAPWTPLPHMVPWRDLGDGRIFEPMTHHSMSAVAVFGSARNARSAYARSIEYSLSALISFLQRSHDRNLVVIALGDHQPATIVTGYDDGHDVPITIFARDPRVMDRIAAWGWQDGMLPSAGAPVWRMDSFRNRFLTAFGPRPSRIVTAAESER